MGQGTVSRAAQSATQGVVVYFVDVNRRYERARAGGQKSSVRHEAKPTAAPHLHCARA